MTAHVPSFMRAPRVGFTLVEMLIAMAVTLLMMAAIARGFAFVGERVKDSRGNIQLTSELTDITTRLRDELSRCTVNLTPNTGGPDQAGYFMYYEGPVTDATSSLFTASGDPDDPVPGSRYGDFDDYLAFTAVAPPGSWFTGKVPRYLLDQRVAGTAYALPAGPYNAGNPDPFEPVVIRSRYAEIIYFVSPEYVTSSLPASPAIVDADGDLLPDRMRLHRRVLLIRPDLNMDNGMLPIQSSSVSPYMTADVWPTATTATASSAATLADGWMFNMAGVHQQCDLSIRNVLQADGTPSQNVAANSLDDLSKPHNRFGHIRVPASILAGGGSSPTSMPVLSLGTPVSILTSSSAIAPPVASGSTLPVVTPDILSGFIRPEFVVGSDLSHIGVGADGWGTQRLGEDVVVNNLLGFDVKIYDPTVKSLTTTNNLVVGPNDSGYREALTVALTDVAASATRGEIEGCFVDLMYPVLAGGSLRGWQDRKLDNASSATTSITDPTAYILTPFSGVNSITGGANNVYVTSLLRCGKIVQNNSTNIKVFQPTFDTYTSFYERDGFTQQGIPGGVGTVWPTGTANADLGSNGLDDDGQFGADDLGEHETMPPFVTPAEAVQVSIRLYNPSTRQIKQMSVVHRGAR